METQRATKSNPARPVESAMRNTKQSRCIVDLKVLSSWLFQNNALIAVNKNGTESLTTILKLVSNPHFSNVLLEQMSDFPDSNVRTAVAKHDNLRPSLSPLFLGQLILRRV